MFVVVVIVVVVTAARMSYLASTLVPRGGGAVPQIQLSVGLELAYLNPRAISTKLS